jgi:hypothetical protein
MSADAAIIQLIRGHKGSRTLLITADHEIINAADPQVAVVDPHAFYLFVFDMLFGNNHFDEIE